MLISHKHIITGKQFAVKLHIHTVHSATFWGPLTLPKWIESILEFIESQILRTKIFPQPVRFKWDPSKGSLCICSHAVTVQTDNACLLSIASKTMDHLFATTVFICFKTRLSSFYPRVLKGEWSKSFCLWHSNTKDIIKVPTELQPLRLMA